MMVVAVRQLQQNGITERPARYRGTPEDRGASKEAQTRADLVFAWLARMGIRGRVAGRLMAREELLADPARILAWWWYALTQERVTRPVVLAANCLEVGQPPPPHYLALARAWPGVKEAHRAQIESLLVDGYDCQALSVTWSKRYPGLTAGAFLALMWLYATVPAELGYDQAKGAWGRALY